MTYKSPLTLLAATSALVIGLAAPARSQDDALQMVSIDVEGGGGTLFVTPDKHSLLIDAGNPEDMAVGIDQLVVTCVQVGYVFTRISGFDLI